MLGGRKANAKYIGFIRDNQFAYRIFVHMAKMYSPMVAEWGQSNWKLVEVQHIQLVELLKFQVLP